MQDATAQMAMLQFISSGLPKVAGIAFFREINFKKLKKYICETSFMIFILFQCLQPSIVTI